MDKRAVCDIRTGRIRPLSTRALAAGAALATVMVGTAGAATTLLPPGHQVNDDAAAGIDPTRSVAGEGPANADVAAGTLTPGAAAVPWAAFQQTTGGTDQIFTRSFAAGAWTTRGGGTIGGRSSGSPTFSGSLNFDQTTDGEAPSIDFAGAGRTVPWATWYEDTSGTGFSSNNVFAARFDNSSGMWVFAGQGRGTGGGAVQVPSLNIHTNEDAENPSVVGGATVAGNNPGPWVTWQETDGVNSQIFVEKPIGPSTVTCPVGTKPAGGMPVGGFCWQQVGTERVNNADPSINVDRTRDGVEPDMAFTGPSETVPWVVWYETGTSAVSGLHSNELVFAAKAVADGSADGGFHWQVVGGGTAGQGPEVLDNSSDGGPCTAGVSPANGVAEGNCSLNKDPSSDAEDPQIAAGTMDPTKPTVPWITWTESLSGVDQIFVAHLVDGDHFELVNNGQPISLASNPSTRPDITFAGNTPYVSWRENTGGSVDKEFLGHFVNAANPTFVLDNGPLSIAPSTLADVRLPISTSCTATPFNGDGAQCQGSALGTPFALRTAGTSPLQLLADGYRPSSASTQQTSAVSTSAATAHGTANPGGAAVAVRFDFGRTTGYGRHTAFHRLRLGNSSQAFTARLSGLPAGTTFHLRTEVRTDFGSIFGADRTFTTRRTSHLTIGASRTITKGTAVSVFTRLTDRATGNPLAGRKVSLFVRHTKTGRWTKALTRTTSTRGKVKLHRSPHRFTEYQWRFGGDRAHGAAHSSIQSIHVRSG
jgi:hypothetical protein